MLKKNWFRSESSVKFFEPHGYLLDSSHLYPRMLNHGKFWGFGTMICGPKTVSCHHPKGLHIGGVEPKAWMVEPKAWMVEPKA